MTGNRTKADLLRHLSYGGAPISIVRLYIEQQQTPHGKRAEGDVSTKPKTRTATPSALSFPALNGGACRVPGQEHPLIAGYDYSKDLCLSRCD